MVFGREIDVHVDEIVGQMLGERVFRFLLVVTIFAQSLEILLPELVYDRVDLQQLLTLQGTLCSVKKSAVPDVANILYPAACSFCTEGRISSFSR